ncbi:MAG: hypothetical protein R3323_08695, partial [Wenzhouxiangellaceae bacterium]|nr:hypothetical protein [Wenzhouxiangellaceae bacterium]
MNHARRSNALPAKGRHAGEVAAAAGRIVSIVLLALAASPAWSLTELVYDAEPNNAPHQAVALTPPVEKDIVRILGSLDGQDQDAYLLVIPDEHAGRRFDLALTGRAGALTKLDVFEFTELVDGRGRIPQTLTQRPANVFQLATQQGTRPALAEGLLLSPGTYVIGVSHSGGQGHYEVELSQND